MIKRLNRSRKAIMAAVSQAAITVAAFAPSFSEKTQVIVLLVGSLLNAVIVYGIKNKKG